MIPTGPVLIAVRAATGFWRCGKQFTKAGVITQVKDFTEKQWQRLSDERMLIIKPASDADETELQDRATQLSEAIQTLSPEDFQKDGKPRVDALNALLSDDLGKISAAERDAVWATILPAADSTED